MKQLLVAYIIFFAISFSFLIYSIFEFIHFNPFLFTHKIASTINFYPILLCVAGNMGFCLLYVAIKIKNDTKRKTIAN